MGKEKYLKDICNWIDCIKGNIQCSLKALHTNAPVFNVWPQCSDAMYMAWIYVNNYLNFWTVLEASQQFMGSKGRQIGMWSWTIFHNINKVAFKHIHCITIKLPRETHVSSIVCLKGIILTEITHLGYDICYSNFLPKSWFQSQIILSMVGESEGLSPFRSNMVGDYSELTQRRAIQMLRRCLLPVLIQV